MYETNKNSKKTCKNVNMKYNGIIEIELKEKINSLANNTNTNSKK